MHCLLKFEPMIVPEKDDRSESQKARDEAITAEPPLPPPDLPADATPMPLEAHLAKPRSPQAVVGIVENGVVRPLDPAVKLPEQSRVIIVSSR